MREEFLIMMNSLSLAHLGGSEVFLDGCCALVKFPHFSPSLQLTWIWIFPIPSLSTFICSPKIGLTKNRYY